MSVAYRFTVRPASSFTCPPGWLDIIPAADMYAEQWNYGTVVYPEPLSFEVADHWSLDPDSGPRVVGCTVDGEKTRFGQAMADARRICYDLAVGVLTPDDVRKLVADKAADYDILFTVDIDENVEGRSCTLWRDA